MADKTMCLAKETCSAKCIIRADWSPVGELKHWLSPTQAKIFPGRKRQHTGSSDVLCFAGPLGLANKREQDLIADRFSSKQIPEEPL
jgi:hypothetical protein